MLEGRSPKPIPASCSSLGGFGDLFLAALMDWALELNVGLARDATDRTQRRTKRTDMGTQMKSGSRSVLTEQGVVTMTKLTGDAVGRKFDT